MDKGTKELKSVNKLEQIVQTLHSFKAERVFEALKKLHQQRFTGIVELVKNDRKKKIWMNEGEIARVQSNLIPELIGQWICHRLQLTPDELKVCLRLQKDMFREKRVLKRLGEWIHEIYGIEIAKIEEAETLRRLTAVYHAFSWTDVEVKLSPTSIRVDAEIGFTFQELENSFNAILSDHGRVHAEWTERFGKTWRPHAAAIDFSLTPFWMILAASRYHQSNGVLMIRKQNRLMEVVIKNGVPVIYYEGSLAQPKQTMVVRHVSEEHEKFFQTQINELLSTLSGSAYFRNLDEAQDFQVAMHELLPEGETACVKEGTVGHFLANPKKENPLLSFIKTKIA